MLNKPVPPPPFILPRKASLPANLPVPAIQSRLPLQAKFAAPPQIPRPVARPVVTPPLVRTVPVIQRAAVWKANDSDSESELDINVDEDLVATVTNRTKQIAKRKRKGVSFTERNGIGKRKYRRVNNQLASINGLAADAKRIHATIPELTATGKKSQSFGATTVVCAVFRKNDGSIRKYCYNNKNRTVGTKMRLKAESLGYHFVITRAAHAEAEMLMHHHTRTGMVLEEIGCDKDHCLECGMILQKFYTKKVASANQYSNKKFKNYHMPQTLQDALGVPDDTRPSLW
jgi:hypothetical protein